MRAKRDMVVISDPKCGWRRRHVPYRSSGCVGHRHLDSSWAWSCVQEHCALCAAELYGVSVYDAPTMLIVLWTLEAVTLVATTVPALWIADIDPARTLRDE